MGPGIVLELATGGGANRADATTRAGVLARAHSRLAQLVPQDYLWEGEIICAVATTGTTARS